MSEVAMRLPLVPDRRLAPNAAHGKFLMNSGFFGIIGPTKERAGAALDKPSGMALSVRTTEMRPDYTQLPIPFSGPHDKPIDAFIRAHWLSMSVREMADALGCSVSSVYTRKHEIGCVRPGNVKREERACAECGAAFIVAPSSPKKFCSLACAYANKDRAQRCPGFRAKPPRRGPIKDRGERTCPHCGIRWAVTTATLHRKYCSKLCSTQAKRVVQDRTCVVCGRTFAVTKQHGWSRTCCGPECRSQRKSANGIAIWKNKEFAQRMSDLSSERHRNSPPATPMYSNRKDGFREDLGLYVRSRWEANVARYLNWLKDKGEIFDWAYEPDTFWFEKIKRGVRSYKPDFKIWDAEGDDPYYWEVKGYDYPRGQTARKRMATYYPKVRLVLIDEPAYKAIAKWKSLIPGWE